MDQPSTDVIQGTLDLLILKTLSLERLHGFGIARRIEQITHGVFRVKSRLAVHGASSGPLRAAVREAAPWRIVDRRAVRVQLLRPLPSRAAGTGLSARQVRTTARIQEQPGVFQEPYPSSVIAYLAGGGGWLVVSRLMPQVWPREAIEGSAHPWKEFGVANEHVDEMVQVFLEDLTIAILFVRLAAALGNGWATVIVIVAVLFAAGHIPTMVSQAATWLELGGLLGDVGLGVAVILVLQRSRDVVWFWCIHFCLDMTQFARVSGVG